MYTKMKEKEQEGKERLDVKQKPKEKNQGEINGKTKDTNTINAAE